MDTKNNLKKLPKYFVAEAGICDPLYITNENYIIIYRLAENAAQSIGTDLSDLQPHHYKLKEITLPQYIAYKLTGNLIYE